MKPIRSAIGRSLKNVEALSKSTGATLYLTDFGVENMVWAYPVYSPIPFGKIISINPKPAEKIAGYIRSIFASDVPGNNRVGVIMDDQPLLAAETVRFVGDVIGLALGETRQSAYEAASLVEVRYEEFEPYLQVEGSKAAAARFIHETNIACAHQVLKGDWEQGFADAEIIVEAEFETPFQEHFYLEPQVCLVTPDDDGGFSVLGSLQCPFYVQKAVARNLNLPLEMVRVEQSPTGGAFGGKEDIPSELCARAAVAAGILGRPVKMLYERDDDAQLTSKRHPFHMRYKLGLSRTGKLISADVQIESNAGAYATLSTVVSYRSANQCLGPYVIPNVRAQSTAYYTNLPPAGAFRGFGSPQVAFGHERIMDIAAVRLGLDPIEFRLLNIVRTGSETISGQQLGSSVGAEATLREVQQARMTAGSAGPDLAQDRYLTGYGVATCIYGNCLGSAGWHMDGAAARILINAEGTIEVAYGLVEMGQGAATAVTQMAAEALGVDPRRITIQPTSTRNMPDSGPSVASRNVVMTGNAVLDAAQRILPRLKLAAADLLQCDPAEISIQGDCAVHNQTQAQIGFADIARHLFEMGEASEEQGWWHVPALEYDAQRGHGEAYFTYSYAAQLAKVRVDRLTGLIRVEKIWAAHDVGRAINPAGIQGQVEGGIAQGVGLAVTENFQLRAGRVITGDFASYLLPTILDVPEVETIIIESPEPLGPWGAKGVGEPAMIPTGAAIANAVSDALGVQVTRLPITPEQVLEMLGQTEPRSTVEAQ